MSKRQANKSVWKDVVPRFLAFFLSTALVVLSVGVLFYLSEREDHLDGLADLEHSRLRLQTDYVEREIREVSSDLVALSKNNALGVILSHGIGEEPEQLKREEALQLGQDIENFARAKGVYELLLIHDRWEREILRMELGEGDPLVIFPELAAWESEAPPMTLDSLPAGHVRFWMPEGNGDELYFAVAIGDAERSLGSLLLAYRMSTLMVKVDEQRDHAEGQLRILDRRGRSLFAAGENVPAAAIFDPSQDDLPLWREILGGEQGQIHDARGLTTYATLAPARWLPGSAETASGDAWKLISHLPRERIAASFQPYFQQLLNIYLVVLSVLAAGSLLLAISRRRSSEAKLEAQASEDRYHRLIDNARELVISASIEEDSTGTAKLLNLNRAATELFGFDDGEVSQMSLSELVAPASLDALRRHLAAARLGRAPMTELEFVSHDGKSHCVEIAFQRAGADKDGDRVLRGSGRDVGDRKRVQTELAEAESLLDIAEAFQTAMDAAGPEPAGALLDSIAEQKLPDATGWSAVYWGEGEAPRRIAVVGCDSGQAAAEILPKELPAAACTQGGPARLDLDAEGQNLLGDELPAVQRQCVLLPLRGNGQGALVIFVKDGANWSKQLLGLLQSAAADLGRRLDLLAARADLDRQREAEQRRVQETTHKSTNAGTLIGVAERMRLPALSLADAASQLVARAESGVDKAELEALAGQALGLRRNIEEILSFARLESGELLPEREEFDWRESLREALNTVAGAATSRQVVLRAEVEKQIPTRVIGDAKLFMQVLQQLLDNAVQHTEEGEVLVQAQMARGESAQLSVNFTVRDTGEGIHDAQQQGLFDGFAPAASGRQRGRGLGLTLASRLVQAMGGRMWVQSVPGQGSSFHFTTVFDNPLHGGHETAMAPPAGTQATEIVAETTAKPAIEPPCVLRLLVAEGSETSRNRLRTLLEELGQHFELVGSGIEAIEAIALKDYDAILLAVQMSEMDGLTAARGIRDYEKGVGGRVPIVAMSAEVMGGDRARCEAAGVDHYLAKPVEAAELLTVINTIAGGSLHDAQQPAAKDGKTESKEYNVETDLSIFDRAAALDRVGGDLELLVELAGMFLEDFPNYLSEAEIAISSGDCSTLQASAHTLKGAVGNFSAQKAYDAAFTLEQIGRSGDLSEAPDALKVLKSELEHLQPVLTSL